jgi:hypothetical protein
MFAVCPLNLVHEKMDRNEPSEGEMSHTVKCAEARGPNLTWFNVGVADKVIRPS